MLRLSVLDQSTIVSGRPPAASIRESIALAQHCEALGYYRYWCAEHHNSESIAGTAPEVLLAAIGAVTSRIRIGSAGIMLPHYSSLKVAEQFRVLDAIAPGRVDLGLGRAPGSDGRTAYALNPQADTAADHFPAPGPGRSITHLDPGGAEAEYQGRGGTLPRSVGREPTPISTAGEVGA